MTMTPSLMLGKRSGYVRKTGIKNRIKEKSKEQKQDVHLRAYKWLIMTWLGSGRRVGSHDRGVSLLRITCTNKLSKLSKVECQDQALYLQ